MIKIFRQTHEQAKGRGIQTISRQIGFDLTGNMVSTDMEGRCIFLCKIVLSSLRGLQ